jgi:hypothetical protein
LGGGGGGGFFSFFPLFPTCSLQVPNMFPRYPMCSSRAFPIALPFNPICFGQNSSPSHLYTWAEGGGTLASHKIFYFGRLCIVSTFFCDEQIKLAHCQKEKEKKVGLVRHPQPINMKQNKYPENTCTNSHMSLTTNWSPQTTCADGDTLN